MTFRIEFLAFSVLVLLAGRSTAQTPEGTTVLPASMVQDERAEAYDAIIAESKNSQIEIDLEELVAGPRVTDLAGLTIRAIAEDGTVTEAVSDRNGRARIDVRQQPTAITATGNDLHMAVLVRPQEVSDPGPPTPLLVPIFQASKDILLRSTEGLALPAASSHSEEFLPLERARRLPALYYQVQLTPDGSLQGRVASNTNPVARAYGMGGMNVSILQLGQVIRTAITGPDGSFVIRDLAPGVYGVIASGRAGYGAFGFEAVSSAAELPAPETVSGKRATVKTVALRQPAPALDLVVAVVPPQMVPAVIDSILAAYGPPPVDGLAGTVIPPPFLPFGGPGMGGGGSGGGGSGAGGGLGGLLIPAAIGAAILAATDDEDEDDFTPEPPSPAIPPPNNDLR